MSNRRARHGKARERELKPRNPYALDARRRSSAGPMKDRRLRRPLDRERRELEVELSD